MRLFTLKFAFLALLPALLGGCANLGQYVQAVGGQMEVMERSQPIESVINDPQTNPKLKQKLETALEIRDFASKDLGLPENNSYRKYADLKRPFATWNVFATPEFSTRPKTWCFVIVGCVSYRGYFSKEDAEAYGKELRDQGYDVMVAGIPAYSTLGHFDDPVLNTFINYRERDLARLIFHELGHQITYVNGDSVFNESMATAIEQEGLRRWAAQTGQSGYENVDDLRLQRKTQVVNLVMKYRKQLNELYASNLGIEEKRQAKAELFKELVAEHEQLKASWGGHSEFDAWFKHDLNNAKIASLSLYTQLVPAFHALLKKDGNDLPAFYQDVKKLAKLPKEQRMKILHGLTDRPLLADAQQP